MCHVLKGEVTEFVSDPLQIITYQTDSFRVEPSYLHDSYYLPSLTIGHEATCEHTLMAALRAGGTRAAKSLLVGKSWLVANKRVIHSISIRINFIRISRLKSTKL